MIGHVICPTPRMTFFADCPSNEKSLFIDKRLNNALRLRERRNHMRRAPEAKPPACRPSFGRFTGLPSISFRCHSLKSTA